MYFQSLRFRIFAAMTIIVVLAMVFTGVITWYQYQEQSKDYHIDRLERKEQQVLKSLENELFNTYLALSDKNLARIFNEPIYEISNIQDVDFSLIHTRRSADQVNLARYARALVQGAAVAGYGQRALCGRRSQRRSLGDELVFFLERQTGRARCHCQPALF